MPSPEDDNVINYNCVTYAIAPVFVSTSIAPEMFDAVQARTSRVVRETANSTEDAALTKAAMPDLPDVMQNIANEPSWLSGTQSLPGQSIIDSLNEIDAILAEEE